MKKRTDSVEMKKSTKTISKVLTGVLIVVVCFGVLVGVTTMDSSGDTTTVQEDYPSQSSPF